MSVTISELIPDEPSFGSVDEVHAVSCEVLPANFIRVMPQCPDLRQIDKHRIQGGQEYCTCVQSLLRQCSKGWSVEGCFREDLSVRIREFVCNT